MVSGQVMPLLWRLRVDMSPDEQRPWGHYIVLSNGEGFQTKLITIKPNCQLSLQKHKKRSETWYILEGSPTITIGDTITSGNVGDRFYIPADTIHRIGAKDEAVKFVELQTGTYFGEDDIERLEDDFGRV